MSLGLTYYLLSRSHLQQEAADLRIRLVNREKKAVPSEGTVFRFFFSITGMFSSWYDETSNMPPLNGIFS